ncbi:MAG: penicillin-binding protein-related factor putative recombinase [Gemmatimonadetes bacterium]|nr:penicillin-binding protein-related factor putative recombinase [Gemmatimonadota bacterium]
MPPANQRGYATNLASEFYVLSALYRLGLDANLTLGNKKGVDIVVACGPGRAFTIEVKAVAGKDDWLVGNLGLTPRKHHYVVLVSYEAAFEEPDKAPRIWIFKHEDVVQLIRHSKTGTARFIQRKTVRDLWTAHAQNWDLLRQAAV